MTIKEFLLEGGRLAMPYKTDPKEWVGERTIHIFAGGFGCPPKIVIEDVDSGHRDWRLDQIDEAVEYFMWLVFNRDNLMYKENETMRELSSKDPSVDLDDDDNYAKMNRLRMVKVENAIQAGGLEEYPEECGRCDGCGWYEGGRTIKTTCEVCGGTGKVKKTKIPLP
jgi:hypothetical protein